MKNFDRIRDINNQCMRNIDMLMQESKNSIKSYKMQQADVMKNIMLNNDESGALEHQFKSFQADLVRREQEQYNQISGRVAQEIDNMKHLILQELSSPSISMSNSMPSMDYAQPMHPEYNQPPMQQAPMNQYNDNHNTLGNLAATNSIENELNGFINGGSSNSTMDMSQMMTNVQQQPMQQAPDPIMNPQNDIPVETKELDEWISEIKNLI